MAGVLLTEHSSCMVVAVTVAIATLGTTEPHVAAPLTVRTLVHCAPYHSPVCNTQNRVPWQAHSNAHNTG